MIINYDVIIEMKWLNEFKIQCFKRQLIYVLIF